MTQFSKLIIKQLIINLTCRIDISLACSYFFVTLLFWSCPIRQRSYV